MNKRLLGDKLTSKPGLELGLEPGLRARTPYPIPNL